jgi:hypothetical protein
MSPRIQVHGIEVLERYIEKCREFLSDWLRFNQVLMAYAAAGQNKGQLEVMFLQLKSKLARDHHVVRERLGADCKFSPDIINIVSGATNLEGIYAQSEVAIRKLQSEWHRAFITVNETIGNLEDKHKRALAGERVNVGGLWIQAKVRKPFPLKQVLIGSGALAGVIVIVGGLYVMRVFLGFWAPGAGDGLTVTAEMTDEEKIRVMMDTMKKAVETADIDLMMTAYSDRYSDDGGRGKTQVRALLQAYKLDGGFNGAIIDHSRAELVLDGNRARIGPVEFIGPKDQVTLNVAGEKEGDKWLITALGGI